MKASLLALLALVFLSLDASAQATRRPQKAPAPSFGSVERTKLLSQNRGTGKSGNPVRLGSVERRAALTGQKVQHLRKPPQRQRRQRR